MVEELVRIAPLVPVMKFCVTPLPSTRAPVPVKVLLLPTYSTPWLPTWVASRLMVPLLVIVPFTVRVAPVVVTESPALLRVRFPMETLKSSTVAAVVRLIRMFSPVVMAPLFQLLALLQFAVPPLPVHVSVWALVNGATEMNSRLIHRTTREDTTREDAGRIRETTGNRFSRQVIQP